MTDIEFLEIIKDSINHHGYTQMISLAIREKLSEEQRKRLVETLTLTSLTNTH